MLGINAIKNLADKVLILSGPLFSNPCQQATSACISRVTAKGIFSLRVYSGK